MTLSEILQHFEGVKDVGSGEYSAKCPACGKAEHLYIAESEGKILLDCKKSKCTFGEIVSAVGLKAADFFPPKPKKPSWVWLRGHVYSDISGNPIARKTIYDKGNGSKTAAWERVEGSRYIKGLNGLKVPPYHVHNLSRAQSIIIAEGEKDVETLEKMGYAASCSPNGAGGRTSWVKAHNSYFKGKKIAILTDNDSSGKEHGRVTAENLVTVAESVRLIPSESIYPPLKTKGDISDIVAEVGIDEAKRLLVDAVKKAELYVKSETLIEKSSEEQTYNADGTGELTIANLSAFLEAKGVTARYNVVTHNFEYCGFSSESADHLKENIPALIYDELHFKLKKCSESRIESFLTVITTRNKFNPVLDKIKSAKWDGTDRLEYIYNIFQLTKEDKLSRILVRKWLMQCYCGLHNSIEKPFSLDIVLVFQGAQGIGKTRFLEKLAMSPIYFGEGRTYDPRNKDSQIECTSKWICELGEIGSTMKKDIDSLKAFLTSSTDEYRLPYGRTALQYARMTSFCGSTNDRNFLLDETGNRRFATISIADGVVIDYEKQVRNFDALQLWAQVAELTDKMISEQKSSYGAVFRLSRDELEELNKRNAEHLKPLKGELEVLDILSETAEDGCGYAIEEKYITTSEFKAQHNSLQKYSVMEIGRVLEKLGYCQLTKRTGEGAPRKVRLLPCRIYHNAGNIYSSAVM